MDRKNDRRKLIRAENKRKRLSDINFEALPPLSPIFESSNIIPLPAGEIFEAETDCVKFEKGKFYKKIIIKNILSVKIIKIYKYI